MKLRTAAAALAIALGTASPAAALDNAAPDRDRHPNVGLLGMGAPGEEPTPWCSGAVLSDHVFLTAAHCIADIPADFPWVLTLAPGAPVAPVGRPAILFDEFPSVFFVPTIPATRVVVHPQFDPARSAHDLAVVLFPAGTFAGVTPVELPRARLLDRLNLRHRSFRLVGYGADPEYGDDDPVIIFEGYRQTARTTFGKLTHRQLQLAGGGCEGDSGSPQLLGESNLAVSLLSDAGVDCRGPVLAQRLDTDAERRFLARYVSLP